MTITTAYEITDLKPGDIEVFEAKGGNVGIRVSIDNVKGEARAILYPHVALNLKRQLARIVDADVADLNEGGFSLSTLFKLRKTFENGGVVDDDEIARVIEAYIRLIERVDQAEEIDT